MLMSIGPADCPMHCQPPLHVYCVACLVCRFNSKSFKCAGGCQCLLSMLIMLCTLTTAVFAFGIGKCVKRIEPLLLVQAFKVEEEMEAAREVSESLSPMLLSRIRDLATSR